MQNRYIGQMKNLILIGIAVACLITACSKNNDAPGSKSTVKLQLSIPANTYLYQDLNFDTSGSSDGTYTWDFGDGGGQISGSSSLVTYAYTKPGNYTVTLKCGTATLTKKIHVYPGSCSFELTNQAADFKYTYVQVSSPVDHSILLKSTFVPNFVYKSTTDTIYADVPKSLIPPPTLAISLTLANPYGVDVSFVTVNYSPVIGTNQDFTISGKTTGSYSYLDNNNFPVSGFGSLSDLGVLH